MPDSLLTVLRLLLLSLIWLFFIRVLFLLAAKPRPAAAVAAPAPSPTKAAAPPSPATGGRASSSKASLRVVSAGPMANKEFVVGNEATVGRGQGCQVQLADPMVSQLHARLFRSDRALHIEDLGSTNGTFVNGKKVGAPAPLHRGDRVTVGPVELEVLG